MTAEANDHDFHYATKNPAGCRAWARWPAFGLFPLRRHVRVARDVYGELGIRPVVNFQGTYTTIGASKQAPELFEAQAEAARHYVVLEELQDAIGRRISALIGCEDAMVSTGTAGAIAIGTYACVAGDDPRRTSGSFLTSRGMKSEVIIQKMHRNGYDHAVRTAGVKIVEVEGAEQLKKAINPNTAMIYMLGGTTGDWTWKDHGSRGSSRCAQDRETGGCSGHG